MIGTLRAALHDWVMRWVDARGFTSVRRRVGRGAFGAVLEIGGGTGRNLAFMTRADSVHVLEPDGTLHRRIVRAARASGCAAVIVDGRGETLPFPDDSFDTVIATLVLCSVDDPQAVIGEIRRVLRPQGSFRFAEHVRDQVPARARRQDRLAGPWARCAGGCRPNRDTLAAIADGGFAIVEFERGRLAGVPSIIRPLIVGSARPVDGLPSDDAGVSGGT